MVLGIDLQQIDAAGVDLGLFLDGLGLKDDVQVVRIINGRTIWNRLSQTALGVFVHQGIELNIQCRGDVFFVGQRFGGGLLADGGELNGERPAVGRTWFCDRVAVRCHEHTFFIGIDTVDLETARNIV